MNNVIIEKQIGQLDGLISTVNCLLGDVDFLQDLLTSYSIPLRLSQL